MQKFIQKIFLTGICAILLFGCCSNNVCKSKNINNNSSSFNQESYVWENFIFKK